MKNATMKRNTLNCCRRIVGLWGLVLAVPSCSGTENPAGGDRTPSSPENTGALGGSAGIGSGGVPAAAGGAFPVGSSWATDGGSVLGSGGAPTTAAGGGISANPAGGALSSGVGGASAGTSSQTGGLGGGEAGGNSAGGAGSGGRAIGGATGTGSAAGGVDNATGGSAAGSSTGGSESGGASAGGDGSGGTAAGGDGSGGTIEAVAAAITKNAESLIALSGLTVVSYGGYLNGESFQQDGIISHNGYQYTAFWNTNRSVVMARRQLPSGAWEKFEFTDYANTEDDAHNTISLGICPGDGTLHLAFDHHGSELHYRHSAPGLTTSPSTLPWAASSFLPVSNALEPNMPVALVTYPRFVTVPGGNRLLLAARIGSSGSGDEFLWEYDAASQAWTSLGKFIDGITDSVNAYLHGLAYTRGGSRLHMAWCWRETPDATTNHDLFYAYSDDHGRSWQDNSGSTVATTGSAFASRDSSSALVWAIGQNRGLINQEHMSVDSAGRVHVLLSHMPDTQADDSNFTNARSKSEFFHYWRDTDGTWSRTSLGLPTVANFRGKLAISSTGNVYAILPDLRIAGASAASAYENWALLDSSDAGRFFSDPLIDTSRLEAEDKLTIYYPQASSVNVWALDYALQ